MRYIYILVLALTVSLVGCVSYPYEQAQSAGKIECSKLPTHDQYQECMQKYELNYQEYLDEREKALEE